MQANSINRARIDWTDFRTQVTRRAEGAQTIADAYPAISVALGLLDDHHSFYSGANGSGVGNPTAKRCTAPVVPSPAVPSDIGYVRIGSFSSTVAGADRAFADAVQQQIRTADAATVIGWVIDLRGNGGGNMWPMVAGVGPVLGEGVAGYFVPPTGAPVAWSYMAGGSFNEGVLVTRTSTSYDLIRRGPKVAVLTDNLIASSGEAVVVSFRGRPDTRSFTYITDLVDGIVKLMLSKEHGPINIGNPHEMTIKQIAQTIIKMTGSKSKLIYKPLPTDDPRQRKPDITLARTKLKWKPKVALQEGLVTTLEYFKTKIT